MSLGCGRLSLSVSYSHFEYLWENGQTGFGWIPERRAAWYRDRVSYGRKPLRVLLYKKRWCPLRLSCRVFPWNQCRQAAFYQGELSAETFFLTLGVCWCSPDSYPPCGRHDS